ncbi:MAG TPA: thioredoxin fold domain-containing protein [Gallionella sp.]|nr:thioredoxin fold domain-containing protein [Gallionella sp.]
MKKVFSACMSVLGLCAILGLTGTTAYAAEKAEFRGAGIFSVPGWFKRSFLDMPDDVAEATRNGKRLLLYFGQDGCPYCAELFNTNFSQPHIVDYTRRHYDAIDLNIWGDREVTDFSGNKLTEKQLAVNLRVWFTPTILLINEKGETVLRINGYYPPHQFLAALKYAGDKQEREMTFPEYYARLAPPPSKGVLHSEPFFSKPPYNLNRIAPGKPLAIFFEQKDCAGCDRMHSNILHGPETRKLIGRFNVFQLDRWSHTPVTTPDGRKTTARDWANELGIAYVPSMVVFDAGKEVIRAEAFLKSFHFQSVLDYVSSGAYKEQPNLQRFIRARADALREQGTVVDIWK